MKKGILLNSQISYTISKMGHMDELTISDAGLPIPSDIERIDLALSQGIPSFLDVLKAVLSEQKIETVVMAKEIEKASPLMHHNIISVIKDANVNTNVLYISHNDFKERTAKSKAVIRTGEFTPYSNIILVSGVVF